MSGVLETINSVKFKDCRLSWLRNGMVPNSTTADSWRLISHINDFYAAALPTRIAAFPVLERSALEEQLAPHNVCRITRLSFCGTEHVNCK